MKICSKCKIEKEIEEFSLYHKNNDGHQHRCKSCIKTMNRDYYNKYKEKEKLRSKICYYNNKEHYSELAKQYKIKNRESWNEYRRKYTKERSENDELFKLTISIRKNLNVYLKGNKNKKTEEILCCSICDFKIYLESMFEYWMNWGNYGKYNGEYNYGWDLDHIIPLSSAKTIEELIELNCYTNIRPLCSKINRYEKRNKMIES